MKPKRWYIMAMLQARQLLYQEPQDAVSASKQRHHSNISEGT